MILEDMDALSAEFAETADALMTRRLPLRPEMSAEDLVRRHLEIWPEIESLGWFDLVLPTEEDGLGLPAEVLAPMFTEVGRHLAPGPLLGTMFAAPWLIAELGDAAAPLLAARRPEARFAIAASSPSGWARGASPRLEDEALFGQAPVVPGLAEADHALVVADDAGLPCLTLVEKAAEGVTAGGRRSIDPCWSFGCLDLDGVDARTAILARGEPATELMTRLNAWQRILIAAEMSGVVEHMLAITVEYVKQRVQFGRPIGSFQAVKHMLAEMACDSTTLRNLLALTLHEAGGATPSELKHAALLLKSHASSVGTRVGEMALQAHGGIGFTAEYELHLYFKHALTLSAYLGTPAEIDFIVGRCTLQTEAGA